MASNCNEDGDIPVQPSPAFDGEKWVDPPSGTSGTSGTCTDTLGSTQQFTAR